MRRNSIFFLVLLTVSACSPSSKRELSLPDKISNIPIGIEVKHNVGKVYATPNENYPTRGGKYKWKYETTVLALNEDLEIVEFGGFILDNNRWIERSIDRRPFNKQEFADWYKCPNGILKEGMKFTDTNNWTSTEKLADIESKTLWYYIATNSEEKRFVGYAEIEMIAELKSE